MSSVLTNATTEAGKKGLKVSAYIIISAVLGATLVALQSSDLRFALQNNPQLVASIPVAMAVVNVIIVAIEKFRAIMSGEEE